MNHIEFILFLVHLFMLEYKRFLNKIKMFFFMFFFSFCCSFVLIFFLFYVLLFLFNVSFQNFRIFQLYILFSLKKKQIICLISEVTFSEYWTLDLAILIPKPHILSTLMIIFTYNIFIIASGWTEMGEMMHEGPWVE